MRTPNFDVHSVAPAPAQSPADFFDPATLLAIYKYRSLVAVTSAARDLDFYTKKVRNHQPKKKKNIVIKRLNLFIVAV
jgi:hypothetical protein